MTFEARITAALFDKTGAIFALDDGSVRVESAALHEAQAGRRR